MFVFYLVIAVLHVLSCAGEKLGRVVPVVNLAVHIAAFAFFVRSGAELEDMLLLLLFSAAVGLAAGAFTKNAKRTGDAGEKGDTE
ncbi:MAG: hypothetical protein ACI4V1_10760 [Eubacteriales bacterium]